MRELGFEILLRLSKALAALLLALALWWVLTVPIGAQATPELFLLGWLSAAALILLVQESPI